MSGEPRVGDFTAQAAAYARARPTYPPELIDLLIEHAAVKPGDAVADVGAGTGISTRLLADHGLRVTAVEPNAAMREQGARQPIPNVTWIDGTFEATGLADASQRWIIAAQAFHWADPPRALPEMRRILAPGCVLSVFWNDRDNAASDLLQQVVNIIRDSAPGFDELYRDRDWARVLTSTGDFDCVAQHDVRHAVAMSRARFVDLWRSHNRLTAAAGPGFAGLIERIERLVDDGGSDCLEVPYRARAWSVRRC